MLMHNYKLIQLLRERLQPNIKNKFEYSGNVNIYVIVCKIINGNY